MNQKNILFPSIFPKIKELGNFKSKEYSIFKKKFPPKIKNPFFNENGTHLQYCHLFKNILQICWIESKFKKSLVMGVNTQESFYTKSSKIINIIELWITCAKNFLKRIGIILIEGRGELWQFSFINNNNNNNNLIRIVLLFGTSVWIVDVSFFLPQFLNIHYPFFKIDLANLFQWKMCLGQNLIITGDICGKITFLKLKKNLKIFQLFHNQERKTPIGDLKLTKFENKEPCLLFSGGYDGVLKIWSVYKTVVGLKEIQFNRRWLIKIDSSIFKKDYILILISFENGFNTMISFCEKIKVIKNFGNQGCSTSIFIISGYIISMGNDGCLNFVEINSPKTANLNYLNLFNTRSFFFNWGIKSKINNTIFQSIGIKYQNNHLKFQRITPEENTFSLSGFHGIICIFCLKNNNL